MSQELTPETCKILVACGNPYHSSLPFKKGISSLQYPLCLSLHPDVSVVDGKQSLMELKSRISNAMV